jgi:hypothetical protein
MGFVEIVTAALSFVCEHLGCSRHIGAIFDRNTKVVGEAGLIFFLYNVGFKFAVSCLPLDFVSLEEIEFPNELMRLTASYLPGTRLRFPKITNIIMKLGFD